jgi:superfamily II DNA or RNA helicase
MSGGRPRIKLHNIHNPTAILLGNWLDPDPLKEFTLDEAIASIDYDLENRHHRTMVYNVINYWRKKAKIVWDEMIYAGELKPATFSENWRRFTFKFNRDYKGFYLLYDKKYGAYYQPNFSHKERLDQKRAVRHVKALQTVLKEMAGYNERLIVTGQPVREALEEADKFTRKYITDHTSE